MKTIQELMELVNEAIIATATEREGVHGEFHIDYAGHVNSLNIKWYPSGWRKDKENSKSLYVYLCNENSIQEAYWFLKNRLQLISC